MLCVHDLLRVFEAARARHATEGGEIYNVGGGPKNAISLLELIALVEALTGRPMQYRASTPRPGDQLVYVTDIGKLERELQWRPRFGVVETLELIHDWWKRNRALLAPAHEGVPALTAPETAA